MYPPCEKEKRCRKELGYLWKTNLCNNCTEYVAEEIEYDFSDKLDEEYWELDEDGFNSLCDTVNTLRQEVHRLGVENTLLNNRVNTLIQQLNGEKGGRHHDSIYKPSGVQL